MISENYHFEAEFKDGRIITEKGRDLTGCIRFSYIPTKAGLPRHDLVGVKMIRRFGRGFVRGLGGGMKEYLHCVVCQGFRFYLKSTDGKVLITPEEHELYL